MSADILIADHLPLSDCLLLYTSVNANFFQEVLLSECDEHEAFLLFDVVYFYQV